MVLKGLRQPNSPLRQTSSAQARHLTGWNPNLWPRRQTSVSSHRFWLSLLPSQFLLFHSGTWLCPMWLHNQSFDWDSRIMTMRASPYMQQMADSFKHAKATVAIVNNYITNNNDILFFFFKVTHLFVTFRSIAVWAIRVWGRRGKEMFS